MLAVWEKNDPDAVMAYAQRLPKKARVSAIPALIKAIAEMDSDQALAVALDIGGEKERATALGALLPAVIKADPEAAEKHILTLPAGKPRYQLMRTLAKERAERDPAAAMAWAKGQEEPSVRRSGVAVAFKAMSFESVHERAEALVEAGLDDALPNVREGESILSESGGSGSFSHGGDLGNVLSAVVKDLAKVDPQAALGLIAKVPPKLGDMDFHPHDTVFSELGSA